jgi:hypothetical protein
VRVAPIARHTFLKLVGWQVIQELSENSLADIHPLLSAIAPEAFPPTGFGVNSARKLSNRKIPCSR